MKFMYLITILIFLASCSWTKSISDSWTNNQNNKSDKWVIKKIDNNMLLQKAYFIGHNIGKNVVKLVTNDKQAQELFFLGLKHSLNSKTSVLSVNQQKKVIQQIIKNKNKNKSFKKRNRNKNNGVKAMESGKTFLDKNKSQPGVKVTSSGLQYTIIKEGTGNKPSDTDNVEVHYRGTLIDGTEFDSSYKRKQTITFPLNGVIKGWTEGLQLMKEGAEYKFYIPSELAYGSRGTPGIPANSVLIFTVELIKIK